MKKIIRLTESDLHRIVKESVKRVIKEWDDVPQFVIKNVSVNGNDVTQEDKDLLLKDLCTRFPYGVKIAIHGGGKLTLRNVINSSIGWYIDAEGAPTDFSIDEVKPYLRPMSSMTKEERNEWADLFNLELDKLNGIDDEEKAEELAPMYFGNSHYVSIDWLNQHHFDYRGLIEKGLALEAPEGMYNVNEK